MKREPLLTKKYFEDVIVYYNEEEKKLLHDIHVQTPTIKDWVSVYSFLLEAQLHLAFDKYSLGNTIEEMKAILENAAKTYILYLNHPDCEKVNLKSYFGIYERCLWLISFGVMFNFNEDLFIELKHTIDKKRGRDFLIDKIASFRLKDIEVTSKIAYPKTFEFLLPVFDASIDERPEIIKNYLKRWRAKMRLTSWAGTDKLTSATAFFGYWSFETAAITYILNIDDSLFREMHYYPKDLIDFVRSK